MRVADDEAQAPLCAPGGDFHGVVGRSSAMRQVFELIDRVASTDAPVLIVGETGTGKELIARAIHERGSRRDGPYVPINCAALPHELIESELFGYQRGAFSGALVDHLGLIRAAGGGTVLLDEITEMSPALQAKLLRVLQEGTVRPVGSLTEMPVDARFIASSNRDVDAALRAGHLRPDLYYRLAVGVISVPPLRERGDDVALLIDHYLAVLNQRYRTTVLTEFRGIATDALALLLSRAWPGNVRELFNAVEQAALQLPASPARPEHATWDPYVATRARAMAEFDRAYFEALVRRGSNLSQLARDAGIDRRYLLRILDRYGIARPRARRAS